MTYKEVLKKIAAEQIGTSTWSILPNAQINPVFGIKYNKNPLNAWTPRQQLRYRASLGNNKSTVGVSSLDMVDDEQLQQAAAPMPQQGTQGQQQTATK